MSFVLVGVLLLEGRLNLPRAGDAYEMIMEYLDELASEGSEGRRKRHLKY